MQFVESLCFHLPAILNSAGLVFDIAGAWLVGWEVVQQYAGKRYDVSTGFAMSEFVVGQQVKETEDYQRWEKGRYLKMKTGLGLLTLGFVLQIVSNWVK